MSHENPTTPAEHEAVVTVLGDKVVDMMNVIKALNGQFGPEHDAQYKIWVELYLKSEREFLKALREWCKAQHESEGSQ